MQMTTNFKAFGQRKFERNITESSSLSVVTVAVNNVLVNVFEK